MSLRPPIPYFGGKQTIAQRIIAEMPAHKHCVEPYCGSQLSFDLGREVS